MLQPKPRSSYAKSIRNLLMVLRRGHLYLGLFLAPWAILYGSSAYLFNHPTHFSDQPLTAFGARVVRDAGLQPIGEAKEAAVSVVAALQKRFPDEAIELNITSAPSWSGEFAFAEVEVGSTNHQLLLFRNGSGGTHRISSRSEPEVIENTVVAPFAIAIAGSETSGRRPPRGGRSREATNSTREKLQDDHASKVEPLIIVDCWASKAREALPRVFTELGVDLLDRQARLTSAPVLKFDVHSRSGDWQVEHDMLSGSVLTSQSNSSTASELSWRRFLLKLHTTHGYPSETSSSWFWAIIVDIMAFVLLFWALSGFIMWWQLKRTRKLGLAVFVTSVLLASYLAVGMHSELGGARRATTSVERPVAPTPKELRN